MVANLQVFFSIHEKLGLHDSRKWREKVTMSSVYLF
jgi:hypothetical protein